MSLDIFATIAALANAPINPAKPLDGVNLIPYLTGLKTGAPHDSIYLRMPGRGVLAVRSGDYKLVALATDAPAELFNVSQDMAESKNLAGENPQVMKELENKQAAWSRQMTSSDLPVTTESNAPQPIDTEATKLKSSP